MLYFEKETGALKFGPKGQPNSEWRIKADGCAFLSVPLSFCSAPDATLLGFSRTVPLCFSRLSHFVTFVAEVKHLPCVFVPLVVPHPHAR